MAKKLKSLIAEKGVLLADGATGTNFFNMGLLSGDAPELWNDEAPEKVKLLHQGFVDAGADIILTNTFGGNAHRLKLHDAQDRVRELNRKAAILAREVADAADKTVLVAGSVGITFGSGKCASATCCRLSVGTGLGLGKTATISPSGFTGWKFPNFGSTL